MKKAVRFAAVILILAILSSALAVVVNAVSYTMTCTVYYVDESGNQLKASVTGYTDAASPSFSVTSPSISGYVLKNSGDSVVTYSMMEKYFPPSNYERQGTATYTVVYAKAYTVTVEYLTSDGSILFLNKSFTGKVGDSYTIYSPEDTGYTCDKASVSGTVKGYNQSFTVTYYPKTYTVCYVANGGTGAPSYQLKTSGKNLILSTQIPTRTNYGFLGWSTSASSSVVSYLPGGTYSENKDITLYAVWTGGDYTVTYNAAGGTGAPAAQVKTYNVPLTLSTQVPTRQGYTFLGWGITQNFAIYQPGDIYSDNKSVQLFAVWDHVGSCIVSYDANGGTGAPASQTKLFNEDLTLSTVQPTRTGYVFIGWAESSTATVPKYSSGGLYTENRYITLYAVWQLSTGGSTTKTYTVTYFTNGGVFGPNSQTKIYGRALKLTESHPIRPGYKFLGWSENRYATTATYQPGDYYMENRTIYLYAVWKLLPTYDVIYNANGGTGAPEKQDKTHNVFLMLSSDVPEKAGSTFIGWATDPNAKEAEYMPGDKYMGNAPLTLYAVWQNDSYDFSVSELTVTPNKVYQYDKATVKFRLDNLDTYNSYEDIPVAVYLNGKEIYTDTVNFAAYGVNYVTFELSVGALKGIQTVEVRINWDNRDDEKSVENNSAICTFEVEEIRQITVSAIEPNAEYIEGYEVISSFIVGNESISPVLPENHVSFEFEVYAVNGDDETLITKQTKNDIVIPANGKNLVYFKWTVPENSEGTLLMCKGTADGMNSAFFMVTVKSVSESQTPNTRYEAQAPASYDGNMIPPQETAGSATWNQWEYIDGEFVLKQYGIRITDNRPAIAPGWSCRSAVYLNGSWHMKSGYGITILWDSEIVASDGYIMPEEESYTDVQNVFAVFPEFNYLTEAGKYRTLANACGSWRFVKNVEADGGERVHFIPVYVTNGNNTVSVTAEQIWTPAGMITAVRNTNTIIIDGSIYDDFYIR